MHDCVFSKTQKQPQLQCTCQAKTVAGSSLTPHAYTYVASFVHPSGTIWTIMNLQGQKNVVCESRPAIFSSGFHVKL